MEECSVVVATHNRAQVLKETLHQLYDLPERPRIYVVDNASSDQTGRVCKAFGNRVEYLRLRRNIGAAARTVGARQTRTPFVAFSDDDCTWAPGALAAAAQRLAQQPRIGVINARVLVGDARREDPACSQMRAGLARSVSGVQIVYFMAGACVMRREAFLEAGGYHVRYFIGGEESLLALDLAARGWELWYFDDVVLLHKPSLLNRDPERRRLLVLRNRLWTLLLRRSALVSIRAIARYARSAIHDPIMRKALAQALFGLPWVLRERRPLPPDVERRAARFDQALTS